MPPHVEIISVGNELLIGKIVNTNSYWIAKRVTTLGMKVRRITTVGDDVEEISNAIQEALQRRPRFIITTGGLGPTFDDKTLEGIARGLGRGLRVHEQALKMIEEKYRKYVEEGKIREFDLTAPRLKMANLPEGAEPLPNPVGTAPGVMVRHEGTTIIALPGVPSEMKAIFEEFVAPLIREAAGNVEFYEASLYVVGVPESEVAPLIDQTMHDNPHVYIKSHPKGAEPVPRLELHFSTTAESPQVARQRVSRALIQLSELVQAKGGKVKPIQR